MKNKWPLFVGIVLLTTGIVLKKTTQLSPLPLILILTMVGFKVGYIISKIASGAYKPGYEVVQLILGLLLFFTGLFIRKQGGAFGAELMIIGIVLKLSFIVVFILKSRKAEVPKQ